MTTMPTPPQSLPASPFEHMRSKHAPVSPSCCYPFMYYVPPIEFLFFFPICYLSPHSMFIPYGMNINPSW